MTSDRGRTLDTVCRGLLALEQPRRGYRFDLDPLLLAQFCLGRVQAPEAVVDLGAGCGVVGLLLGRHWPRCAVHLVELQAELADLGRENAARNALAERAVVHHADLRSWGAWPRPPRRPVLVVSNPPYFPTASGRVSADPQVAMARHELRCTLEELVATVARNVAPGDLLALIHLATRRESLLAALGDAFVVRRVRDVHPLPGRPRHRVLVLAERRGAEGSPPDGEVARVDPPLVVAEAVGRFSEELRDLLEPMGPLQLLTEEEPSERFTRS